MTSLALVAFAANSVLTRMALAQGLIDPGNFTLIRLISGAMTLAIICFFVNRNSVQGVLTSGTWLGAFSLWMYAVCFSYGYLHLDTATGALILFTTVQLTMLIISYVRGQRFSIMEWVGLIIAFMGFVVLILPNLSSGTTSLGILLMVASGIAWGSYTLLGKGAVSPTLLTTGNFIRASIMSLPIIFFSASIQYVEFSGVSLAIASGALASGIGYALWYTVLPKLTTSQAAVSQLLVPALAAFGGVLFTGDRLTTLLIVSLAIIMSGIFIVIRAKAH